MTQNKKNYPNDNRPGGPQRDNNDFQWKRGSKTIIIWVIIIMAIILLTQVFQTNRGQEKSVPYSQYLNFLENNMILEGEVVIQENEFRGVLKEVNQELLPNGKTIEYKKFKTILPFVDEKMVEE